MEHNQDSQLNRGRVVYRPKHSYVVNEDEDGMLPDNLSTEKDKQNVAAQNTEGQDKSAVKKESKNKNSLV